MTAGQISDYTGARALLSSLPTADWLLGDRGYDTDWLREALVDSKRRLRPIDFQGSAALLEERVSF